MKITFSYEWEIPLLSEKFVPLKMEEIKEIAYEINNSIKGVNAGADFLHYFETGMLEFRTGIRDNLKEIGELTEIFFEKLKKLKKKNIIIFSSGTFPLSGDTVGFHVHLGSFFSFEESYKYDLNFLVHVPFFVALSSNSPVYTQYIYGKFKSYRVFFRAWGASSPSLYMRNNFRFFNWGRDVCNKVNMKPTVEIRVMDAPVCYEFITECVGLLIYLFFNNKEKINEMRYREYLTNRLTASKFGLQAVFLWNGKEREIKEIYLDVIDKAERYLKKKYGFRFKLIPEMVEKRISQADFSRKIFEESKKDILNYILKTERYFFKNRFPEFLRESEPLNTCNFPDIPSIILEFIGKRTDIGSLVNIVNFPFAEVEKILKKLQTEGKIKSERNFEYGTLVSRKGK